MADVDNKEPSENAQIICGVVIEQNGTYLLVQEKKPEVYGKWNLPSGRIEAGETLEQAAVREAKEETGYDVVLGAHHFVLDQSGGMPTLHAFSASIVGGELRFEESEILDARWFTHKEIAALKHELRNAEFVLGAITFQRPQVQ